MVKLAFSLETCSFHPRVLQLFSLWGRLVVRIRYYNALFKLKIELISKNNNETLEHSRPHDIKFRSTVCFSLLTFLNLVF